MRQKCINAILAFLSALTFTINYKSILNNGILSFFDGKYYVFRMISTIVLTILCYFFYKKYNKNKSKIAKILAITFAIFVLIGNSFIMVGSLKLLYSPIMILFSFLRFIGLYYLLSVIISFLEVFIPKLINKTDLNENRFIRLFNKKPFLVSLIIMASAWSIYYVAYYPATLSPDPSYQIKQFFNEKTKYVDYSVQIDPSVNLTNHHPVFHTILLGTSIVIGRAIVNDNFGLFIYTFIQGLALAATFAYTIKLLKKYGIKNKYLLSILLIYSFVPMFPFYAINCNKDVYFSIMMIWLSIILFDFIENYRTKKLPLKKCFLWFGVALLLALFRNNGLFLILLICPFILFFSKINWKRMAIVFTLFTIIFISYNNILLPSLKITGTSVREVLSIFFQQTARYTVYYEDEISESDKNVIGKIIDFENIKEKYNPIKADPVKSTFNKYATSEDLLNYFKVWGKSLFKHPLVYAEATLHNIYGYFTPEAQRWYIYYEYDTRVTQNDLVDYHYNELDKTREVLKDYAYVFRNIPVIGLISNIGFNTWLMIAMIAYLMTKQFKKYLIVLLPVILTIMECILSPVNTYFRYAMHYIFIVPLLIGFWFIIYKKNKKN